MNTPPRSQALWPPEDTGSNTVNVAAGAFTGQEVCRIQAKNARRFFLDFIANAIDSSMIGFITFRIKVDGTVLYPFIDTKGQWADPSQPIQKIPPIELPQNALVIIEADGSAQNPGGNITGRLAGFYTLFNHQGG